MSQRSRHSSLQKQAANSSRGSLQGKAKIATDLQGRRPSGASVSQQADAEARSYQSMTMPQRRSSGAQATKMIEEAGLSNMLPDIEQHKSQTLGTKPGSRVQSATKRSTASLKAATQTFGDQKKGPIKAFEQMQGAQQNLAAKDVGEGEIEDRFNQVIVKDAISSKHSSKLSSEKRRATLDPIPQASLKSSQKKLSTRDVAQKQASRRSSQKLSNQSVRDMARSQAEIQNKSRFEQSKLEPGQIEGQERPASVMQIPPATQPSATKVPSSDHPVINLDLHQVDIDHEVLQSKRDESQHDQEATVVSKSPYRGMQPHMSPISQKTNHLASNRSHNRQGSQLAGESQTSHSATRSKTQNKPRPKRVNQFKQNKMSHEEIISFLFDLSSASVGLNRKMEPTDLDSTQGLDSFLAAIIYINEQNVQKKDQKLVDNLHLSTGTRTNFCLEVLNFIIKQQAKETIFIDAVEFFQESLEHMVEVENENVQNKKLVEELSQQKTELTIMRFDLQNKLRETSHELLKLRQKEYEQQLLYAETKQHLQAKQAETESLHYRLKHLGFGVTDSVEQLNSSQGAGDAAIGDSKSAQSVQQLKASKSQSSRPALSQKVQDSQDGLSPVEGAVVRVEEQKQFVEEGEPRSQDSAKDMSEVDGSVDLNKQATEIEKGLITQVERFKTFKAQNFIEQPASGGPGGNLQRLQDLLNQVQIDNKNFQEENNAYKNRLESKDRLVAHLENRVTNIMIEHEETILKLKSEIVLLKNQIDTNEDTTTKQLLKMRERVEGENEQANGSTIREMTEKTEKLTRENGLQKNHIDKLSKDYQQLHAEFEKYRTEKQDLEAKRDVYVGEVEQKLTSLSKNHINAKNSLGDRIKSLESNLEQKTKENQILYLRLRYMRQTADVLLRQKQFLSDTLLKSKQELESKMNQLEQSMLSQNKNKSYLVSIEKAIKQSRNVAEISKSAMQNILQIVKFFKVEKIHSLVFETQEPSAAPIRETVFSELDGSAGRMTAQARASSKPYSEEQNSDEDGVDRSEYHLEKIQAMLNDLKTCLDLPVNFKPRIQETAPSRTQSRLQMPKVNKNEEYYLEHCPTELISALLKVVVEVLIRTKSVNSVETIPYSISRLLYLASNRSDQPLEKEIFEQFCFESNKIMVDEINHFADKVETFEKIQNLVPSIEKAQIKMNEMVNKQRLPDSALINIRDVEEDSSVASGGFSASESKSPTQNTGKKPLTMMQQSALLLKQKQQQEAAKRQGMSPQSAKSSKQQHPEALQATKQRSSVESNQQSVTKQISESATGQPQVSLQKQQMKNELELLILTMEEQKEQNRLIQQGLAEKVIKLEETIDFIKEDHEEKLSQAEFSYRQELEQIRLGTMQRERQLLLQIEQLSERNAELEITTEQNFSQQQNNQQKSNNMLRKSSTLSQKRLNSQFKGDNLRQAASVHSLFQAMDNEAQETLQALERRFETYKSNVKEFVRIRESTHGTISLVFEASKTNIAMINESILVFYLSRIFRLPKSKFRFLKTYHFFEEKNIIEQQKQQSDPQKSLHKRDVPVEMIKVVIEIIEDHSLVRHDIFDLKTAIRDGSSLLYDLLPSYLCINMGHSGLATSNNIKNCTLISKQGRQINGVDFVINLMRSTINPYCFIVVILNLETGEEYCLELDEKDVMQITEGDRGLLEDADPLDLNGMIIDNLELIERDGVKFLTCTNKVFFNQLWHGIMTSKLSHTSQHQQPSKVSREHDVRVRQDIEETQINAQFTKTTIRDENLLKGKPFNKFDAKNHFKKLLMVEQGCQTDFEGSILYDSMVTVFKGHNQLNSEIKIDMEVQQSQHENLVQMIFKDSKSQNTAKFCVFNRLPAGNSCANMINSEHTEENQNEAGFEQRVQATGNNGHRDKSQYIIHSEVISVGKEHLVMVCVERIQNDGFLVKLHDLKMITSDEFYLIRKSNGHLTRFNLSQNLQLMYQEDFRNLIFDLAFAQQTQSQDLMLQNLTYASEKLQAIGKSPHLVSQELFASAGGKQAESRQVRKLQSFTSEAFAQSTKNQEAMQSHTEWRSLQEKGLLLYRDVKFVRTNFDQNQQKIAQQFPNDQNQHPQDEVQESLISLYLKEDQVNIEVFLYNDEQKMSINTNVPAIKLFGREPNQISFTERVQLLDSMLEKLFVLQQDGRFHMKVEHQAEPISSFMERIRSRKTQFIELGAKSSSALKRRQNADQAYEEKIREIQMEKTSYVKSGKARMFQRYITLQQLQYAINIYVTIKQKKAGVPKQSNKRLNTVGKTQQQIEQQKIEIFLEENGEFDSVYIETQSPINEDLLFLLLDRRQMAKILTKDVTCDWRQLLTMWTHDLMDYLFKNIVIDLDAKKLDIYNSEDITELLVRHCRNINGGQLLNKEDNLIVDGFGDESSKLLRKTLVMNEEVDFTEISYDIKLFKISRNSPFGQGNLQVGSETLSYHIEIFNVNQPDIIYKHRIPVQQTSTSNVHDPVTFVVDVFNLIDNQLVDNLVRKRDEEREADKQEQEAKIAKQKGTSDKAKQTPKKGDGVDKSIKQVVSKDKMDENTEEQTLQQQRNQMDKVMSEHSTKYQLLFKKYIDNQLILVVQENKFPASISFTLVEPSSRLIWKTCYEPLTEIVSPSSFSVVDQGAFETFMTMVYDSVVPMSIITKDCTGLKQRGDWHNLLMKDQHIVQEKISDSLNITIKKELGKLNIVLQNPQYVGDDESVYAAGEEPSLAPATNKNQSQLNPLKKSSGLTLTVQNTRGVYFNAKILNLDDCLLDQTVNDAYLMLVKVSIDEFKVQILKMHTQSCVFEYKFRHSNSVESDIHITPITQVNPIKSLEDIKQHVVDAIKNLNSEHVQEQVESNHIRIQQEKTKKKAGLELEEQDSRITTFETVLFKVQECPSHQQRFYQRKYDQFKVVTLHRKIYYDETMEKLIIITANIKYKQGIQRLDNPMLLQDEINEIDFKILEPEHNTLTCLTVPLSHCFNERQLMALNKRDMLRLKSLVRIVLEERSDIRRKEMDQDEQHQAYTLFIMPQPEDQFIDEAQIQEEIAAAQSPLATGVAGGLHSSHNSEANESQQSHHLHQHNQLTYGNSAQMSSGDSHHHGQQNLMHQSEAQNMLMDMDDMEGIGDGGLHNGRHMLQDMDEDELQHHYNQGSYDLSGDNQGSDHPPSARQQQDAMQQDGNMMASQANQHSHSGSSGHQTGKQQRAQTNSIIMEEASQDEKDQIEQESNKTPGGSIYHEQSQSSMGQQHADKHASHQSERNLLQSDLTGQKSRDKLQVSCSAEQKL